MAVFRWGATTDAGRVRSENEDTFVTEPMVFAVADGMGGHQAGEVASALAASILRDRLGGGAISEDAAAAAVGEANAAIYGAAKANPAQSGMGTTVTAIAVLTEQNSDAEERLVLLNVGDSRTYRFRAGRLQRVTVDHSYVQELVAAGHISIEEARTHPRRNIVTRALGIEPVVRADMWTLPIVRGDRFVLASDGLVDEVPDHEILDLVAAIDDPQELSRQLVEIANRHGGHDNVTVVVVDVVEGADPPDSTDELHFDPAWAEGTQEPAMWADDELPPPDPAIIDGAPTADSASNADDITVRDLTAMPTLPPPPAPEVLAPGIQASPATAATASGEPLTSPPPPPDADALAPALAAPAPPAADEAATTVMDPDRVNAGEAATATDATAIKPVLPAPGTGATPAPGATGMTIADSAKAADAAPKRKRRRFTGGAFLFVFLIAAIVTVTFTLIAVHARSGYFVGFEGDTVVVFKGQRDSVLWFEPTVNAPSRKTRDQLSPAIVDAIEARPTFDSADEAAAFIQSEVIPTTVPETTTTTTAAPTTTAATIPGETTTTTVQGP